MACLYHTPWPAPCCISTGDTVGHPFQGIAHELCHGFCYGASVSYRICHGLSHMISPELSHGLSLGTVHGLSHGHTIFGIYAMGLPMGCSMGFCIGIVHEVTHGLNGIAHGPLYFVNTQNCNRTLLLSAPSLYTIFTVRASRSVSLLTIRPVFRMGSNPGGIRSAWASIYSTVSPPSHIAAAREQQHQHTSSHTPAETIAHSSSAAANKSMPRHHTHHRLCRVYIYIYIKPMGYPMGWRNPWSIP